MKKTDFYVRDQNNPGAVLNTDNRALDAYKKQKAKMKRDNETTEEINNLKTEVSDIKSMLHLILERLK